MTIFHTVRLHLACPMALFLTLSNSSAAPEDLLSGTVFSITAEVPASFERDKAKDSESVTAGGKDEGVFAAFKVKVGNTRVLCTKSSAAFANMGEYELALPIIKEATTANMGVKNWQANEMCEINGRKWHLMRYQFEDGRLKQSIQYVTIAGTHAIQVSIVADSDSFKQVSVDIEGFVKSIKIIKK